METYGGTLDKQQEFNENDKLLKDKLSGVDHFTGLL